MKIQLQEVSIRDLVEGYSDSGEDGVRGYGGKLDIRPPYQREFIYKDKQRDAVIDTITKNFPLNVMYWVVRDDGTFEILDGQQRTISICQYIGERNPDTGETEGDFSFNGLYFHSLPNDRQEHILDYKLMVYFCSGTESEKLEWFRTINIAGEKLTDQELRNAVYAGPWVSDAKRHFSRLNQGAHGLASEYVPGSAIRQELLETAIRWISDDDIEEYMSVNQHRKSANELWSHFQSVINWVTSIFPNYRMEMKRKDWIRYYDEFHKDDLDPAALEIKIKGLMEDSEIRNKKGIYPYVLTREERHLNLRTFDQAMKRSVYEKQNGICKSCNEEFELNEMEADHITPWIEGGKTNEDNCQMLCRDCNRRKSAK